MKKLKIANNEGFVLLIALGIMVTVTLMVGVYLNIVLNERVLSVKDYHKKQVFWLAEAGLQDCIHKLNDSTFRDSVIVDTTDENYPTTIGPVYLDNDSYTMVLTKTTLSVTEEVTQELYSLTITATVDELTHTITQSVLVVSELGAFDYAIYVSGDIHSSETTNFTITGKTKTSAVNLPTVDFAYYKNIADPDQDITGHYTFTDQGTEPDYSGIWYVDGNVVFESNVTFEGTIVGTGKVDIKNCDNVTITATSPYPALIANGNFTFQNTSDLTINGLIYVGSDMKGNFLTQQAENIIFNGTIIVAGNFNLQQSKNIIVTYDPTILTNPPPGITGGGTIVNVTSQSDWF